MKLDPFAFIVDKIGGARAIKVMNVYLPYVAAGVRAEEVAADLGFVRVAMRLKPWTKNAMGTHFGGSLYAMCDPWFMLLLIARLGPEFLVWDKSAAISFLAPGRGTVRATFAISKEEEGAIRAEVDDKGVCRPQFSVTVKAEDGSDVCRVDKVLSVRRRKRTP